MKKNQKTWWIYLLSLGMATLLISSPHLPVSRQLRSAGEPVQRTGSPSPTPPSRQNPTSYELRGVWLTNFGGAALFFPQGVNRVMYQLRQQNFNTVYPVVWNRGNTFYPSSVAKTEVGRAQSNLQGILMLGRDALAEIVQQGNRFGLRVIPWFEYGFMAPANSQLAKRHPNWLTKRQNGTKLLQDELYQQDVNKSANAKGQKFPRNTSVIKQVWLNPLHPEVQQFILDLILEVVTKYDVDGIQLDDHFSLPVEFGYDPFTIKLYQQEHLGKKPPSNYLNAEWMHWRANKITDFMQRIFQAVKSVKPDCLVSLSPNPQYFAYRAYLQDWQTWVQRGLIEELICQVYRADLKAFLAELTQPTLQMARRRIPVGIGILTGSWRNPIALTQIQQQVQTVRERGFAGVSFFYWETLWGYITSESPQQRRKAFQKLFSTPAKNFI